MNSQGPDLPFVIHSFDEDVSGGGSMVPGYRDGVLAAYADLNPKQDWFLPLLLQSWDSLQKRAGLWSPYYKVLVSVHLF